MGFSMAPDLELRFFVSFSCFSASKQPLMCFLNRSHHSSHHHVFWCAYKPCTPIQSIAFYVHTHVTIVTNVTFVTVVTVITIVTTECPNIGPPIFSLFFSFGYVCSSVLISSHFFFLLLPSYVVVTATTVISGVHY